MIKKEKMIISCYHVGKFPRRGTIQRDIMDGEVHRLVGGDYSNYFLEHREQVYLPMQINLEINNILKTRKATHEFIMNEAIDRVNNVEINRHKIHLLVGVKSEDYLFLPGEGIEHLFIEKPERIYKDDMEFARESRLSNLEQTIFQKGFRWVSKMAETFTSTIRHDAINRPYMSHFFKPDETENRRGLSVNDGDLRFIDASARGFKLWEHAVKLYNNGHRNEAYFYLGKFIHLIEDLHVPAHVHNDIHAPWPIDKKDSYEEWCGKNMTYSNRDEYLDLISREIGDDEKSVWNIKKGMNSLEVEMSIINFFTEISTKTQIFRSVDAQGYGRDQYRIGKLSDGECLDQATVLIPRAIYMSAYVIEKFREIVK